LTSLINTPSLTFCVPLAAVVFTHTGSCNGALIGEAVFLGLGCLLALSGRGHRVAIAA
jgi:hypothetical protein